jgi:HD-GYP domain-containing protein (c-di-GMP phosphodiesterase class II)
MTTPARPTPVPLRIRLYAAATVLLAAALVPLAAHKHGSGGLEATVEAVALAALIAGAIRHPVTIGLKRRANVAAAPEVAAVLLLPGWLALLVLTVGMILGEWPAKARPIQRVFNAAVSACRAGLGAIAYAAILRLPLHDLAEPLAAVGAAGTMYLTGTLLVIGIASVQLGENPLRRSWAPQREIALAETLLGCTGILAATAIATDIWTLPLLVAPAIIAQKALRDGVALRAQTRLALIDLADIVDMRDHYTFEHSKRVAELARATARRLGLDAEELDIIWMAGRVHDVGKIGIKSSVLLKPGRLTDEEFAEMQSHPVVGARLIGNFPQFARGRAYVLHHHERWDGKGYPGKLRGEQIPLGARILAVADAWDAMTSHRAYRKALPPEVVRAELARGRGTQFDPRVLDAFLATLAEQPELAAYHTDTEQAIDSGAGSQTAPTPA